MPKELLPKKKVNECNNFFVTFSPTEVLVYFFTNANVLNGDITSKLLMPM